jgi:hypothetical protein
MPSGPAKPLHAMGVAVFSGMIGVTAFGIVFTPMFYVLLRALAGNRSLTQHGMEQHRWNISVPAGSIEVRSHFIEEKLNLPR